ncbi:MAG: hypothetical protein ACJ75J_10285 [Cytophagaceae bacterium]
MKSLFAILIATCILSGFSNKSLDRKKSTCWSYCNSYEFEFLELRAGNSFEWYHHGCLGVKNSTGQYTFTGDTLRLNPGTKEERIMLMKENKIYMSGSDIGNKKVLTETIKDNLRGAIVNAGK